MCFLDTLWCLCSSNMPGARCFIKKSMFLPQFWLTFRAPYWMRVMRVSTLALFLVLDEIFSLLFLFSIRLSISISPPFSISWVDQAGLELMHFRLAYGLSASASTGITVMHHHSQQSWLVQTFILLQCDPSIHGFFRDFILKGSWVLSESFSSSIKRRTQLDWFQQTNYSIGDKLYKQTYTFKIDLEMTYHCI